MEAKKNIKHPNSPDIIREQAVATLPFLKVVLRFEAHNERILNAIDECQPIIPVLTEEFGLSRRCLHNLSSHTALIAKIFQRFPLPRMRKNQSSFKRCNQEKWRDFSDLTKTLAFIAPDHQPKTGADYFELIKTMRFIYGYWISIDDKIDEFKNNSNNFILTWVCARAWTHIKRRPLKLTPIPTTNHFIIRHLRAWRDAVRTQHPGELLIGKLPGKHFSKMNFTTLKLFASQWALLTLFDRHPADLQKLLDNWPNQVRDNLAKKLNKYASVSISNYDEFSTKINDTEITFKKITNLGEILKDAITAKNCMADYCHILLTNENMDFWRIYEKKPTPTLIGHVMRCHKNGTLLTEGFLLGNKPIPQKFSWAIKALQSMAFHEMPKHTTGLRQSIANISHYARLKALSAHAKATMANAAVKFQLYKTTDTDISQVEEAMEFLPAARKLAQQINMTHTPFPILPQINNYSPDTWTSMLAIISGEDIPTEIVEAIKTPNNYRHRELVSCIISSTCIEFHKKYTFLNMKLTKFQVDGLIKTVTDGNEKIEKICSAKDFVTLNAKVYIHILLLCHIFFADVREADEKILITNIAASTKKRVLNYFFWRGLPLSSEINTLKKATLLYSEEFDLSTNYILDIIYNRQPSAIQQNQITP